MKTLLIICLFISAFVFTGCEAIVESRQPARYGAVYDRPGYNDDSRYYYRDGRRYDRYQRDNRYERDGRYQHDDRYQSDGRYDRRERDVVVVNRPVVMRQPQVYSRSRPRVVEQYSSDRQRDIRDARDDRKKKKKQKKDDN